MPNGRVAVWETDPSGHRLLFIRYLLEEACIHGRPLLLTTQVVRESVEYDAHIVQALSQESFDLRILAVRPTARPDLAQIAAAAAAEGCAQLVIPGADSHLAALLAGWRRYPKGLSVRYLIMRTPAGGRRDVVLLILKYLAAALLRLIRPSWRGFFLTDSFQSVTRRPLSWLLSPIPDPVHSLPDVDRDVARRELGLNPGAFVVGVLGGVSERKNVLLLIDAIRRLPEEVVLLLAGRHSTGVREHVLTRRNETGHQVVSLDRNLSDRELAICVRSCDLICLLHDLDGPSGMMAIAAVAGVPVLVGESPWLRKAARMQGLGRWVDHDASSVALGLSEMRRRRHVVRLATEPAKPQDFAVALLGLRD